MFVLNLYSRCFENIPTYIQTYILAWGGKRHLPWARLEISFLAFVDYPRLNKKPFMHAYIHTHIHTQSISQIFSLFSVFTTDQCNRCTTDIFLLLVNVLLQFLLFTNIDVNQINSNWQHTYGRFAGSLHVLWPGGCNLHVTYEPLWIVYGLGNIRTISHVGTIGAYADAVGAWAYPTISRAMLNGSRWVHVLVIMIRPGQTWLFAI